MSQRSLMRSPWPLTDQQGAEDDHDRRWSQVEGGAAFQAHAHRLVRVFQRDKYLYLMVLLPLAYFIVFHYIPMYGITLAFKDFDISEGIMGSPWVGLKYFEEFFSNPYS